MTEARSEGSAATHHTLPVSTLAAKRNRAAAEDVESGQALPGLWQLTTTTLAGGSLEPETHEHSGSPPKLAWPQGWSQAVADAVRR